MSRFSSPSPAARRGFTLVELVVSLTLLGLLASLALPELSGVVVRAKQGEREVMMNAILQAVNDYAREHGGQLPGDGPLLLPRNPDHVPDGSRQLFSPGLGHWGTLDWVPEGPLYFRYDVTRPAPDTVVITAQADLDHNGQVNVKSVTCRLQDGVFQRVAETESADLY
jgi:prepilin-type N-terminal cleavage/methylation domain-containing protein